MPSTKFNFRVIALVFSCIGIALAAAYSLLKPVSNGCTMTYMYPTYIPIPSPANVSSSKYGLYLYHEGWRKIDFNDHIKKLSGIPVLFIPGNGGSYKQVRSLGAESDRAYQGGPLEKAFYQEASLTVEEMGLNKDLSGFKIPNQYNRMLDWFAVDLEGEHSAMDGRILEEHTEYVVYAIHRILDLYKENHETRVREGAAVSLNLPKSVILVGHSMGGFVARAAIVHPFLRKSSVETVLTLSSPHQSPPLALQPSLGHYYARVNEEWRKGYDIQNFQNGRYISSPRLSNVIVVSISGGINDYQVRAKLESLEGIVPPTHGFMISSSGMKNVWLSMEHQVILWCNQLVVQVSHTLLSLIDHETGLLYSDETKRLAIFAKMLRSGVPDNWLKPSLLLKQLPEAHFTGSQVDSVSGCPSNVQWSSDGLERDLYIETNTVTVLAMDGRRRWLDINKLGSNGRSHFIFVTNLIPCSGVKIHLWPEKGSQDSDISANKALEVTSKIVHIPSGPAPRQIEPGSQTEQAPPSAVFWLSSMDMRGYRFITISVAPSPAISGRPPPAASMGVGQFFNPDEGKRELSPYSLLLSLYSQKDIVLKEDHPLAVNLQFTISLGLLPVELSVKTTGCGIKESGLPEEEAGDMETNRLCKLRCFPPVALAWDSTSGLHIFPNLYSEIIEVDSSPAIWSSNENSERTTVLLLVDPHCSYTTSVVVSFTASARRFLLLYFAQIVGFSFAIILFALMRQAHAWELDLVIPSVLSAVVYNLKTPLTFLLLAVVPIIIALLYSLLTSEPIPQLSSFFAVSLICYLFANGCVIAIVSVSQLLFYMSASLHVFLKKWLRWERKSCYMFFHWFFSLSSSFLSLKVIRIIKTNPLVATSLVSMALVCFVHPALGLFVLLFSHALSCHNGLSSFLTASFNNHALSGDLFDFNGKNTRSEPSKFIGDSGAITKNTLENENTSYSPSNSDFVRSYGETQLEIFHHQHGLLILHFLAALMFGPSFAAWVQRISIVHSVPWFWDSVLCIGVILHGICDSKPEYNFFLFKITSIGGYEARLSFAYFVAGYWSYISGLALAPYRAFYGMATVGFISFVFRILERRNRERGEAYHSSRKHSHRH